MLSHPLSNQYCSSCQPSVTQLTAAPLLSRPYFCIQFHLHIIACYRDVYKDQRESGNPDQPRQPGYPRLRFETAGWQRQNALKARSLTARSSLCQNRIHPVAGWLWKNRS
ncbi:MAG: hypothetical protein M1140_14805, partial [Chloroflexi bacterium]|nr:hypothetical protein [Chloroflexota bacterium]